MVQVGFAVFWLLLILGCTVMTIISVGQNWSRILRALFHASPPVAEKQNRITRSGRFDMAATRQWELG